MLYCVNMPIFFIHPSLEGHVGFQFLHIMNKLLWTYLSKFMWYDGVSFGYMPMSSIAFLGGNYRLDSPET